MQYMIHYNMIVNCNDFDSSTDHITDIKNQEYEMEMERRKKKWKTERIETIKIYLKKRAEIKRYQELNALQSLSSFRKSEPTNPDSPESDFEIQEKQSPIRRKKIIIFESRNEMKNL